MTTTTGAPTVRFGPPAPGRGGGATARHEPYRVERLRAVLRVNAAISGAAGVLAVVLAGPLGDLLGTPTRATGLVGAALVPFATVVALTSRMARPRLGTVARVIGWADGAWVVGTVVLVALGVFDTAGIAVMAVVAIVVDAFATVELRRLD